jgi:hypothetical protein
MAHRALATQKKLAYLGFQCLDHPLYSPDLAPSDCHIFSELKKLKGKRVVLRTYQHPGSSNPDIHSSYELVVATEK